jgi:hypothetical protein
MEIDSKIDKTFNTYLEDDKPNRSNVQFYKNTYIYGWGKNKYGELGQGTTIDALIPTYCLNNIAQ